ncbi:hypothetical protein [Scytonema sp. PCC 10023]
MMGFVRSRLVGCRISAIAFIRVCGFVRSRLFGLMGVYDYSTH